MVKNCAKKNVTVPRSREEPGGGEQHPARRGSGRRDGGSAGRVTRSAPGRRSVSCRTAGCLPHHGCLPHRGCLPSEQLRRLADRSAAALVLPVPVVDHERALPAEALARVLDAVEASTTVATKKKKKKAYRSERTRRLVEYPGADAISRRRRD